VVQAQPAADALAPSALADATPTRVSNRFGLPDFAAIVAIFVIGCLFLERRLYEPPAIEETQDEPELVTVS
jgi:hypothetical protein